jgi:hypothetical protein
VGDSRVFVRAVDGPGKWQVSPEIGNYPRWRGDGRELFYVGSGVAQRPLLAVSVPSATSFSAGPPRVLVPELAHYLTATAPQVDWDASPSGDRFVFIEIERGKDEGTRIDVALHWGRHLAAARVGRSESVR